MPRKVLRFFLLGLYLTTGLCCSVAYGEVRDIRWYKGLIWAATENGLLAWRGGGDDKVTRYGQREGIPSDDVLSLLQDGNDRLWARTGYGMTQWSTSGWVNWSNDPILGTAVSHAFVDREGRLWAVFRGGIGRYTDQGWEEVAFAEEVGSGPEISLEAQNGDIWYTAGRTVFRLREGQLVSWDYSDLGVERGYVATITEDKLGNIWLGGSRGAVSRFDGASWETWTEQEGIGYDRSSIADVSTLINGFLVDNDNRVWAWGVLGINMYDGDQWHSFSGRLALLWDVIADAQGNVWVTNFTSAVSVTHFNGTSWVDEAVPLLNRLFLDSQGRIWGMGNTGVFRYDAGTWEQWTDPNLHSGLRSGVTEVSPEHFWFWGPERIAQYKDRVWRSWSLDKIGLLNGLRDLQFLSEDKVAVRSEYEVAVFDGSRWQVLPLALVDIPTNITQPRSLPETTALFQNYPNPFNAETVLRYALPQSTIVRLTIYDTLGRVIKQLKDERQEAGLYDVIWDGKSESGDMVSTGGYFYRLVADDYVKTQKMVLCR